MNRKRLGSIAVLLTVLVFVFGASPVFGHHKPEDHGKGEPGGLTGLDVDVCLVSGTICVSSSPELHFHVTVTQEDDPVKGATVVMVATKDTKDGDKVGKLRRKTGSDGVAHFEKKNPGPTEPGKYVLSISATKDEASGPACLVISVAGDGMLSVPENQSSC